MGVILGVVMGHIGKLMRWVFSVKGPIVGLSGFLVIFTS